MKDLSNVKPRDVLLKDNLLLRGIPYEYMNYSLADYRQDKNIFNFMKNYLLNMHSMYKDGINLCMFGKNGTGKTMLGSLIVKEAYRLRYNSAMITLDKFINLTYKGEERTEREEQYLNTCLNADFLVIDEVGKENFPKSKSNIVFLEGILREAYIKHQIIVLITNLPLEDVNGYEGLYTLYGKSIQSLISNSFIKLEFKGDDFRKEVLKSKDSISLLLNRE